MSTLRITDYGAVGDDSQNDRSSVQRCIDAAVDGDTVVFPRGVVVIDQAPVVIRKAITLTCEDGGIVCLGDKSPSAFDVSGQGVTFSSFNLSLEAADNFAKGIVFHDFSSCLVEGGRFIARMDGAPTNDQWTNMAVYAFRGSSFAVRGASFAGTQVKLGGGEGGISLAAVTDCAFADPVQYAVSAVGRAKTPSIIEDVTIARCVVTNMRGSGAFYVGEDDTADFPIDLRCRRIRIADNVVRGTHAEQTKYVHGRPSQQSYDWSIKRNSFTSDVKAKNSYGVYIATRGPEDALKTLVVADNRIERTDKEGVFVAGSVQSVGSGNIVTETRGVSVCGVSYDGGYWP